MFKYRESGQKRKEQGCLKHLFGHGRCFFVVTGSTASENTDSRKGWSLPAVPLSWQEIKGKCVENKREEFLERERT
jgi:hypothetical protein